MSTPSELVYPVLVLTPKGFAYTVADEVALRSGNALAVRSGHFDDLRAIDSTGAAYRVTRVHGARIAPGEWLGRILGRLANPRMTVELDLVRDRVLTLDDVKAEVRRGILELPHVHDEEDGGTRSILSRVKAAASISELFDVFTGLV